MTNTVNNSIPFVPENTTDPAAGLNLSLLTIDMLLHLAVESVGDTTPPATVLDGARYIVGVSATGAWSGHDNQLAMWVANPGYWTFRDAYFAYNKGDDIFYIYTTSWIQLATQPQSIVTLKTNTTTAYTLIATDAGKCVETNNASANTVTIPPNSSVAFPVGTKITVRQYGAGQTSIVAGAGVKIIKPSTTLNISARYGDVELYKRDSDEWYVSGYLL